MKLYGEIVKTATLKSVTMQMMYELMDEFYEQMNLTIFHRDLAEKDYCIMLYDERDILRGFSTQKVMSIKVGQRTVNGVFSGDTIIHRDYWGSTALFKVFVQFFFAYGEKYPEFYWFLISKGYKTYKILPLFFREFYPRVGAETPFGVREIMRAFGKTKYPEEYDENSGVIKYRTIKDRLKEGVAEITEKQLRDRDIKYFLQVNPGYVEGDDLVCLTKLKPENLRPTVKRIFWGK